MLRRGRTNRWGVLMVEDNVDARESIAYLLALRGYSRIFQVGDGLEALGMMRAEEEAILTILLDIGLPGLDGYSFLRRLQGQQRLPVGVIALTGYGQPEDQQRFFSCGTRLVRTRKHMVKPADPGELLREIALSCRAVRKLRRRG